MRADVLGVERRQRCSLDEKARLVAETLAPCARVSEVARRNDVATILLFTWRRQTRVQPPTSEPVFLPVRSWLYHPLSIGLQKWLWRKLGAYRRLVSALLDHSGAQQVRPAPSRG